MHSLHSATLFLLAVSNSSDDDANFYYSFCYCGSYSSHGYWILKLVLVLLQVYMSVNTMLLLHVQLCTFHKCNEIIYGPCCIRDD